MQETIVKRGRTYQGTFVELWSDGAVTWALGRAIRGLGIGVTRSNHRRRLLLDAGMLALAELELFDDHEVAVAVSAAREWTRRHFASSGDSPLPGNLRRAMALACRGAAS